MNQRPIKEFSAGNGVKATIWANNREESGRKVVRHSVRISKSYRDRQTGDWKDTDYYFANDLPRLTLVAQQAFEFIALKESEDDSDLPTVAWAACSIRPVGVRMEFLPAFPNCAFQFLDFVIIEEPRQSVVGSDCFAHWDHLSAGLYKASSVSMQGLSWPMSVIIAHSPGTSLRLRPACIGVKQHRRKNPWDARCEASVGRRRSGICQKVASHHAVSRMTPRTSVTMQ